MNLEIEMDCAVVQTEDDMADMFRFWNIVFNALFLLQLICVFAGLLIVFCGTKKSTRPRFVTTIWALIIATCLLIIIEMFIIWYANNWAESDAQALKYTRVARKIEALAQCIYSAAHWIFALEYFKVAL